MAYKAVDMEKTSEDKCKMVVRLYKAQKHSIKEIMEIVGVPSAQTIYAILDEAKVPRLKARKATRKISVSLDEEIEAILSKEKPKNTSKWLCEMAKKGYLI